MASSRDKNVKRLYYGYKVFRRWASGKLTSINYKIYFSPKNVVTSWLPGWGPLSVFSTLKHARQFARRLHRATSLYLEIWKVGYLRWARSFPRRNGETIGLWDENGEYVYKRELPCGTKLARAVILIKRMDTYKGKTD